MTFTYNKDKNVHRYAVRGDKREGERERDRERDRETERERERQRERLRDRERERERERVTERNRERDMLWKIRYSVRDPNYGILLGICPLLIQGLR